MTLSDLMAIIGWVKRNGRNRISDEDKVWAKTEIDKAETFNDLAAALLGYLKNSK